MLVFLNKAKSFFLFLYFFSLSQAIFSQNWSDWQTVYNANNLKVELAFNKYNCEITQKQSKYKYNVTGTLFTTPKYLNWKMQYLDCDNNLVTQQNSINIGKDADDGILESMDNVFSSRSILKEYFDVELSDVINTKVQKKILTNTIPLPGAAVTINDIDGNIYNTITIGTQTWMSENLRTTRYNNGDYINKIVNNQEWKDDTLGAWCYYENDKSNDKIFGKLYNWYAVTNEKGVCPLGWHVPNNREWNKLIDELGGSAEAGSKMKLLSEWKSGLSADNSSGFSGIPADLRRKVGDFATIEEYAYYWSSSFIINKPNALCFILGYKDNNCFKDSTSKNDGLSCRCVKDNQ